MAIEALIAELQPAGAIYFAMDEADVERILAYPETMIGSDGLPHDTFPHPRLWGAFPRVLGHYARRRGLFSLETAIHKMTGLPAARFGLGRPRRDRARRCRRPGGLRPRAHSRRGHLRAAEAAGRRHRRRLRQRGRGLARRPRHRRAARTGPEACAPGCEARPLTAFAACSDKRPALGGGGRGAAMKIVAAA
jgi:hypothetical protein